MRYFRETSSRNVAIYTGQGKGDRKIGDRLDPQELKQAQVYIIHSLDPRYAGITNESRT